MCDRQPAAALGDRARPGQERGLTQAQFIGSFPAADFPLNPERPEVAFAGRSNVGKSSLLNALVGRRALARTSRTPGKTRALNVYNLADQAYLVDLPGYGYARLSRTERSALSRLLQAYFSQRHPAGVVWLLDLRRDPSVEDLSLGELLAERRAPAIVTFTKVDRVGRGERRARVDAIRQALALELPDERVVLTSAKTREGVLDLRHAVERLVGERIWG